MFKILEAFKRDDWMYVKVEEHQEICKELSEEIHSLEEELEKIHGYGDKLSNLIKREIKYLCDCKLDDNHLLAAKLILHHMDLYNKNINKEAIINKYGEPFLERLEVVNEYDVKGK